MVVSLRGEHDMNTAPSVAEALAGANAAGDGDLVVDLSEVQFMDSAIITVLVRGRNDLRSQSRDMTLRAPSRSARRVLDLCGLVEFVEPVPAIAAGEIGRGATAPGRWLRAPRLIGRLVRRAHLRVVGQRTA
jgi:anti-sigma B factor antagonist